MKIMKITVNYDAVQNSGIKSGEYEVIVSEYKGKSTTTNGYVRHELVLTVRNDINQPYKNALIFLSYVEDALYNYENLWNAPSRALGIPNHTSYDSFENMFKDWVGLPAKVTVEVTKDEKGGKVFDKREVRYWYPTQYPNVQHVAKNAQTQQPAMNQQQFNQAPMGQQSFAGTGTVQSQVQDDLPFLTDNQPQGGNMNAPF